MMLDFRYRVTIYKLSRCLNNYILHSLTGGIFFGHPVCHAYWAEKKVTQSL